MSKIVKKNGTSPQAGDTPDDGLMGDWTTIPSEPDFSYGSPEEYFYCTWISEDKPQTTTDDETWALWKRVRIPWMTAEIARRRRRQEPDWAAAWERSLEMQRDLRQQQKKP